MIDDTIVVHVKGNSHPYRFRDQDRSIYIYATAAVLNGQGFILKSAELGEFTFAPGSVSHVHSYMGTE